MLEHTSALVCLLAIIGTIAYGFYKSLKLGKVPTLRPLPAIAAVDELIGRATEQGRSVHMGAIGTSLTRDTIAGPLLCALIFSHYVARKTAQSGVRAIFSCQADFIVPMLTGLVRDAYAAEGKLDQFDPGTVEMGLSGIPYATWYASMMEREKTTSTMIIGWLARTTMIYAEQGRIADCLQIGATTFLNNMCFVAVAFDYSLVGDELYAAAAYMGQDPARLGSIEGMDWVKWWTIALTLISIVAAGAGVAVDSFLLA